jgi:integrase
VAPLVIFMADTGARPAEAVAVEWRHVDLEARTVELPGSKTNLAWRTVHLTRRGLRRSARCRLAHEPQRLSDRRALDVLGVLLPRRVVPALEAAGLEHRAPHNLRHSYALHCLQAGVPIATLARQMGHDDVNRTFATYGGWVREMGLDAAAMRERWAARAPDSARGAND